MIDIYLEPLDITPPTKPSAEATFFFSSRFYITIRYGLSDTLLLHECKNDSLDRVTIVRGEIFR